MLNRITIFFQRLSENIARLINQDVNIRNIIEKVFISITTFATRPQEVFAATTSWCQVTSNYGRCYPPNGKYCSSACSGSIGMTSKCPSGYEVSYAWGFRNTGCWCDTQFGSRIVCCDCTSYSTGLGQYSQSIHDCGCMHII